jgi:hypothetical protein
MILPADPGEAIKGGYMMAIIKQGAALLAMALIFAGCTMGAEEEGATRDSAIMLIENTWKDSSITTEVEQWFRFTATTGTSYLHIGFGTLAHLYVQVYDSGDRVVGDEIYFGGSGSGYTRLTITSGRVYYVKVTPHSGGGAYRITFNDMPFPPLLPDALTAEMLTGNVWKNGALTSANNEQWFKFTATAATQYLHARFSAPSGLSGLYVQLYDSNGEALGNSVLTGNVPMSFPVMSGQTCYVRVSGQDFGAGTYWIAFNSSDSPPNFPQSSLAAAFSLPELLR